MRRTLALLIMTIMMMAGLTTIATSPASADVVQCAKGSKVFTKTINDGSTGNDDWYITGTLYYQYCKNHTTGRRWAVPLWLNAKYNQEGTSMGCDVMTSTNALRYVRFTPKFWDRADRDYHPGAFDVPCSTSTTNNRTQDYSAAPRMYWESAGSDGVKAPRFHADVRIEKAGAFFDADGTIGGYFSALF